MTLTDESPMPFGKHKGEKMANVPASYLLWLYYEWPFPQPITEVKAYIEDNLDVIKEQIKRIQK